MDGTTYFIVFAVASIVAFVTTATTLVSARRLGLLDHPGPRTFHTVATPRLGGIGIIAGFSFPILALMLFPRFRVIYAANREMILGLVLASVVIIGLGLYDDLFGANAWKKFLFQGIAAAILVQTGFVFGKVSLLGMTFELNGFAWLATMVWIVGIINAVNFIDGMDGLAATIALTLSLVFATISLLQHNLLSFLMMIALAGSLTGFLPLNRRPARIFMGDTGSMFLGLLLATMTVASSTKTPVSIALAGPMLALALPVLDTLFVIRGRFFQPGLKFGERVFKMFNADRSHFHHRLYKHFGSHTKVVVMLWTLTLLFGAAAIMTSIQQTMFLGKMTALTALALVLVLQMITAKAHHADDASDEVATIEKRWEGGSSRRARVDNPVSSGPVATLGEIAQDLRLFLIPNRGEREDENPVTLRHQHASDGGAPDAKRSIVPRDREPARLTPSPSEARSLRS